MRNGRTRSYLASLLPGLLGLGIGVAITLMLLIWPDADDVAQRYKALSEFLLWRVAIIVQMTAFIGIAAYLVDASGDPWLPRLTPFEKGLIFLMTASAIGLPHRWFRGKPYPLDQQEIVFLFVVISGILAMVLLTIRLGRIHAALAAAQDPDAHRQLRRATQDLLVMAAAAITLGTLGIGILQISFKAMAPCNSCPPLERDHVLAYGAYFSLIVLLFFAPIFAAERASATRVRDRLKADNTVLPPDLDLEASLVQRLAAAFAVLTPLLGAIGSQLLLQLLA